MLLQANDYLWLHDHLGCELQIGGSDQWGNIVSGVDLIRRKRQAARARAGLAAADGAPTARSSARRTGARLWLDPAKTSPYQFHQHWMQLDDAELEQQFPMFSLRPLAEIDAILRRARRRTRAAARPAGAGRRGDRARPRRRTPPGPPARPPTCCSAATRWRRRAEALEALAGEVPSSRADRRARRRRRRCSWRPGWPRRRATPAACSSRAASGPTACRSDPDDGLRRRCPCCTTATCCCARESGRTTWWRFSRTQVDAPDRPSIVFHFALGTGPPALTRQGTNAERSPSRRAPRCVPRASAP